MTKKKRKDSSRPTAPTGEPESTEQVSVGPSAETEERDALDEVIDAVLDGELVETPLTPAEIKGAVAEAIADERIAAPGKVLITFDYESGDLTIDNATGLELDIRGRVTGKRPPASELVVSDLTVGPPLQSLVNGELSADPLVQLKQFAGDAEYRLSQWTESELKVLPTAEQHLFKALRAAFRGYRELLEPVPTSFASSAPT